MITLLVLFFINIFFIEKNDVTWNILYQQAVQQTGAEFEPSENPWVNGALGKKKCHKSLQLQVLHPIFNENLRSNVMLCTSYYMCSNDYPCKLPFLTMPKSISSYKPFCKGNALKDIFIPDKTLQITYEIKLL